MLYDSKYPSLHCTNRIIILMSSFEVFSFFMYLPVHQKYMSSKKQTYKYMNGYKRNKYTHAVKNNSTDE